MPPAAQLGNVGLREHPSGERQCRHLLGADTVLIASLINRSAIPGTHPGLSCLHAFAHTVPCAESPFLLTPYLSSWLLLDIF